MAIKKLTFSFDVPLTSLLGLIATGQADMRIDVLGDDKPLSGKALAAAGIAGLLSPPKTHGHTGVPRSRGVDASGNRKTAQSAMLEGMAKATDYTLTLAQMRPLVAALGLSPSSANSQIATITKKGWAEPTEPGIHRLTESGLKECARRGFEVLAPVAKGKPAKQPKNAMNGAARHG